MTARSALGALRDLAIILAPILAALVCGPRLAARFMGFMGEIIP